MPVEAMDEFYACQKKEHIRFSAYKLAVFMEYTAWGAFGGMSRRSAL